MSERKAAGPGRPKLPVGRVRSRVLAVKLREDELEAVRCRAARAGMAVSAFVREVLLSGPTTRGDLKSGPTTRGEKS